MMWLVALSLAARAETLDLGGRIVAVELTSPSGPVKVRTDPAADHVVVERTNRGHDRLCPVKISKKGDTAVVAFGPRSPAQPERCASDFEIVLPPGGRARAETGEGALLVEDSDGVIELGTGDGGLTVRGGTATLTARVPSGEVWLEGPAGAITLAVGTGEVRGRAPARLDVTVDEGVIELSGLSEPVIATARKGRVLLTFATAPASGRIEARATGGPAVVDLPGSPTVTCHVASTGGTATCELPQAREAPLVVHAIADGAPVRVH